MRLLMALGFVAACGYYVYRKFAVVRSEKTTWQLMHEAIARGKPLPPPRKLWDHPDRRWSA